MCGIVGIFPAKINTENITQKAKETVIRVLSTEILVNLQERGKDATGTFVHFDSGEWLTIKQPVPADEFVLNISSAKYPGQEEEVNYRSFLNCWKKTSSLKSPTRAVISHVRKKTQGSEYDANNNHPLKVGNIIGVHNGGITNDARIFEVHPEFKRIGLVDSEAVFQMLSHLSNEAAPTMNAVEELDKTLRGTYAIFGANINHPGVVGSIRRSKPLEYCLIEKLGLIIAVSEKKFVNNAIDAYNRLLLSMSASVAPMINTKDVVWTFILDDSAVIFDVSKEVENLSECVVEKKLGIHYNIKNEKYTPLFAARTWDYTTNTWKNETAPKYDNYNTNALTPIKPKKAIIEDISIYPKQLTEGTTANKSTSAIKTVEAVSVVANVVDDEDDFDANLGYVRKSVDVVEENNQEFQLLKTEGRSKISKYAAIFDLFSDNIDEYNIDTLFSVPNSRNTDTKLLAEVANDSYEEGFSDGWACKHVESNGSYGSLVQSEKMREILTGLVNKTKKLSASKRKSARCIANLKTMIKVMLVQGNWADINWENDEEPELEIQENLFSEAKRISKDSDSEGFFSIFSKQDVEEIDEMVSELEDEDSMGADEDDEIISVREEGVYKTVGA